VHFSGSGCSKLKQIIYGPESHQLTTWMGKMINANVYWPTTGSISMEDSQQLITDHSGDVSATGRN